MNLPETGGRRIKDGSWCLISELGPGASSAWQTKEVSGFAIELPLSEIKQQQSQGLSLPQKLKCLTCPGRDAAFIVQGPCCGRLAQLAEVLMKPTVDSLSAGWMRQSHLAELVARVFERPELQENSGCRPCCCGRDLESIKAVAVFLREQFAEEHSIPSIARAFHLNECKLKMGFKEHFGTTVFKYLRDVRMEQACSLLRETDANILEVANAVGYSNASHFARAFREVHALNPKEVRGRELFSSHPA